LNAAKPELEAAELALKSLDKAAIVEIKSFPNPPGAVVMVCEAVMVLLGENTDWVMSNLYLEIQTVLSINYLHMMSRRHPKKFLLI